ncbi:MAG TPA: NAD-binding protein [Actinomycetota bacterium]|nr:NAD-binding protein [Actinomycetota bacterium]
MKARLLSSPKLRRTFLALTNRFQNWLLLGSLISVVVLFVCGLIFWGVERSSNPQVKGVGSGLEWVSLTLLAQSTPWDIVTGVGKFLYYLVLFVGVSLAAMATGAIASKLVEYVMRKGSGMGRAKYKKHIVICGWNSQAAEILRELHAEEVEEKRPIVILAELDATPTRDPLVTFVRGVPSDSEDLMRACIDKADTAIIVADTTNPNVGPDDRDAKTLLTTLAVESINPACYTCVEVVRSENRQHFERTRADELVVSAELTGALLASSAVTHGLSRLVSDLITHPQGNEFYALTAPASVAGSTFGDTMIHLKEHHDCVLVAVAEAEGQYTLNPPFNSPIREGDRLLVISTRELTSLGEFGPAMR